MYRAAWRRRRVELRKSPRTPPDDHAQRGPRWDPGTLRRQEIYEVDTPHLIIGRDTAGCRAAIAKPRRLLLPNPKQMIIAKSDPFRHKAQRGMGPTHPHPNSLLASALIEQFFPQSLTPPFQLQDTLRKCTPGLVP